MQKHDYQKEFFQVPFKIWFNNFCYSFICSTTAGLMFNISLLPLVVAITQRNVLLIQQNIVISTKKIV